MSKGKRTHMQKIRECIYRMRLQHSLRQICKDLQIHRSILRGIRNISHQHGWLDPTCPIPDDLQLHQVFAKSLQPKVSIFEPYHKLIKEWQTAGYSCVVIHKLLRERISCSIYQVGRYLRKEFPKQVVPIMVRQTYPGEVLEVDFGFLGLFWDALQSKFRKTWVFSARLRHSRRAYREVVFDQSVVTFIKCHIHAFEHFGGVTLKVVLDNLKAGVIKSCIDNDQLNRSYREMAEYYQTLIDPCLPYTPQHKGGVENDVNYIKKSFLPFIKEKKKHQPYLDLKTLQEELEKWDREVANVRIVYGTGRSPAVIFAEDEKATLKPLPESRWDIAEWHQCEVRKEWRVMWDNAYYSVPYYLIGQTVQIMSTTSLVRIFFEHNQVASHQRASQKWEYRRNPEHAPPFKEMVLSCTREGLLIQSEEIGPCTHALVQKILSDPVVDKLKPIRKLLSLALSYEKERIEAACKRALHYNTLRYQSVKDILENGLDQEPVKEKPSKIHPLYKYARNPKEYQIKPITKEVYHG
jgi:transposase